MTAKSVQSEAASASSPSPLSLQLTSAVITGARSASALWVATSVQAGNNDTPKVGAQGRSLVREACFRNRYVDFSGPTAMRSVHAPSVIVPIAAILTNVSLPGVATGPWTDEENDLIVADYFAMLAADLTGRRFIKADHKRRLRTRLDRSRPSIEFKHRNISAVLKGLGETWLTGYRPAFNIQMSLADASVGEPFLEDLVAAELVAPDGGGDVAPPGATVQV